MDKGIAIFQKKNKIIPRINYSKTLTRFQKAVSNIVGTIFLLTIAVTLTTAIYILVVNSALNDQNTYPPRAIIIGAIEDNNKIILEHRGGDPLALNTIVKLHIAGEMKEFVAESNLSSESKADGEWNIGECLIYNHTSDISYVRVEAMLIDPPTNSMIMNVVIQEGELSYNPYVRTNHSDQITSNSARLHLYFNFRNHTFGTGYVRFGYRPRDGELQYTDWYNQTGNISGTYNETIADLTPNWYYQFFAMIRYNVSGEQSTYTEKLGAIHDFWTFDWRRGIWHFNTGYGDIAYDSSQYENHGSINGWAAWEPTGINGTYALRFDGIDDTVEIKDSYSLDLDEAISIEAWLKPLDHREGFEGEPSLKDTSAFGITNFDFYEPDMIHVSGNIYAIACGNANQHGFVITVEILNNGTITANHSTCIIDALEFETSECAQPDIIHVSGDIYAIAYQGESNDGWLKTVKIFGNGTVLDTDHKYEFYGYDCDNPKIINVSGDIYAIVYTGADTYGRVTTVGINTDGTIDGKIETLNFHEKDGADKDNTSQMYEPDIILVNWEDNEGVYAIAYRNFDGDGVIRTIRINRNGNIIIITVFVDGYAEENYNFARINGFWPEIIHINDTIYAIAFGGGMDQNHIMGEVHTVEISTDGDVTPYTTEYGHMYQYERTVDNFWNPEIIHVGGEYYAITYRGPGNDGFVKTVEIDSSSGHITHSVIGSLEFGIYDAYEPNILNIDGEVYAVVYRDDSRDGMLKTLTIQDTGIIPSNPDPVIDAHELGIFNCYESNTLHVYEDIYAMAYQGVEASGWIKTVKVENDGSINNTFIDTFEIEPGYLSNRSGYNICQGLKLIHVYDTIYAVVYQGPDSDGWMKTVSISDNGIISYKDKFEYHTGDAANPDIINLSGEDNFYYFSIAFRGYYGDGILKTVKIEDTGDIDDSIIDQFGFDLGNCADPDIINIKGDTYAIAYRGGLNNEGMVATVNISDTGTITQQVISNLSSETNCIDPEIIHVNGTFYAIAFQGPDDDGWVATINISDTGIIADSTVDTLEFDKTYCQDPNIIHISERIYAVVYRGADQDGWLKTFRIGENGNITNLCDRNLEFDLHYCKDPEIIHIHGDIYAIIYGGGNNHYYFDMYFKTGQIKLEENRRSVISKASYFLEANATKLFAGITTRGGGGATETLELSVNLSEGWNYIVLTYNTSGMKLYKNATEEVVVREYNGSIITNDRPLIFGDYNCELDEVIIYSLALTEEDIIERFENPY